MLCYSGNRWQGWNLNPGLADSELRMTFELVLNEELEFTCERKNRGPSWWPRDFKISKECKTVVVALFP